MIKCPQCNNDLFQEIVLGHVSEQLELTPSQTVFVCAQCGYKIESEKDIHPATITLNITASSEAYKRKALAEFGFGQPELEQWTDPVLRLDKQWFITKKDYEKHPNLDIPPGYVVNLNRLHYTEGVKRENQDN